MPEKTKVLLVRPSLPEKPVVAYPPVNLISIIPYFRETVDAELFDCQQQTAGLLTKILTWHPDVVAITSYSYTYPEVNRTIADVRAALKLTQNKCKIIVGGAGVTASPEYAMRMVPDADMYVAGDGELFADNFDDYINSDAKVMNSGYFNMHNKKWPSWHMVDHKRYRKYPGFAVESSRGCPFNCIFCSAHLTAGKLWRPRPVDDVVAEMKMLREKYNVDRIYFPDDNSTVDPKRWKNLMQKIIDAKLHQTLNVWEGIQAKPLDMEALKLMKEAGFESIVLGVESGCNRVLKDVIDKGGLQTEWVEQVIKNCKEIGLMVNCFFVIGITGETLDEAKQTVEFAQHLRELGAYSCIVRSAQPLPGTRMFGIAKEKGYLTVPEESLRDVEFIHSGKHFMKTEEWTPEQIEELVSLGMKQDAKHILTKHPWHIVKKGAVRIFTDPKRVTHRIKQLGNELAGNRKNN